jgi:hypothetical protein
MLLVNLDEVRRGHDRFLADNERLIDEETERAGRHATEHVRKFPLFKPRTGKLQSKQKHRVARIGKNRRLVIFNTAAYANSIDAGARPHIILPKYRNKLRFRGRNGQWVFADRVRHPGNKPYRFGFRATQSAYRVLGQSLKKRMSEAASRF